MHQRFFAELKRRRVFRVMALYGAAAFAVLQVADLVVPLLGWPESVTRIVALSLLVGFPLAVALEWAFDFTPFGLRRESEASPGELKEIILAPASQPWPSGLLALAGLIALLAGAWYVGRQSVPGGSADAGAGSPTSLAVLPFLKLSSGYIGAETGIGQSFLGKGEPEAALEATARILAAPLTTVDPNPGNEENSQTTAVEPAAPTVSGDLLYTTDLNGPAGRIFTKTLPSGTPQMIGTIQAPFDPVWSPDRSRIAYVRGSLYVVDSDGSNETELVDLIPFLQIGNPTWVDNNTIAFHAANENDLTPVSENGDLVPDFDLYTYDITNQTLTQLTENAVHDRYPDVFGGAIGYVRGDNEIRTIGVDGAGDATLFTTTGVAAHPDGR